MTTPLADLMAQDLALPVAPTAITRVIRAFDEPNPSADSLARDIGDDPVLTAQLLRSANSAYFGLGRKVVSPLDAVRVLGFDKVRGLVMTAALKACFHTVEPRKMEAVWSVSLNAADVALNIGRLTGIDSATAYTAGLLHAVGMSPTASTSTRSASRAWLRTRRSSWAPRDRHSSSVTTRSIAPRSCPGC